MKLSFQLKEQKAHWTALHPQPFRGGCTLYFSKTFYY